MTFVPNRIIECEPRLFYLGDKMRELSVVSSFLFMLGFLYIPNQQVTPNMTPKRAFNTDIIDLNINLSFFKAMKYVLTDWLSKYCIRAICFRE